MPDETPIPHDSPDYDELTEELKALRAFRDEYAREYAADPEKVRAKERAQKYPGFRFATPGQTSKAEEQEGHQE